MKYTGEKCFSCGKPFEDSDDVVVCPDCGTPYHRECFKNSGECINTKLHESGESWKKEVVENETPEYHTCPRCYSRFDGTENQCPRCGYNIENSESSNESAFDNQNAKNLFDEFDVNKQNLGFNPDENFDGAKLKEITQFVDTNTLYYIPIFKRMKDFGTKVSFNAISLFFPYFYFANRKMWLWAVVTALLSTLFNVPSIIYLISTQETSLPFMESITSFIDSNSNFILNLIDACNFIDWAFRIIFCMFSNWIYFKYAVHSVNKLKNHYGGPVSPQCLKTKGGVKPVNILIIGAVTVAFEIAIYFITLFVLMFLQQSGLI